MYIDQMTLKSFLWILLFSFFPRVLAEDKQSYQCSQMLMLAEILLWVDPWVSSESKAKAPKPASIWILRGKETFLECKAMSFGSFSVTLAVVVINNRLVFVPFFFFNGWMKDCLIWKISPSTVCDIDSKYFLNLAFEF